MIENTVAIKIAGRNAGNLMFQIIRHAPALSSDAASYNSPGITRIAE